MRVIAEDFRDDCETVYNVMFTLEHEYGDREPSYQVARLVRELRQKAEEVARHV